MTLLNSCQMANRLHSGICREGILTGDNGYTVHLSQMNTFVINSGGRYYCTFSDTDFKNSTTKWYQGGENICELGSLRVLQDSCT